MKRADIISTVGRDCLTSNIENDEFSYPKAYSQASLPFNPIKNRAGRAFEKLDIRFVKDNVTVLIETKQNFHTGLDDAKEQLSAYVEYEKALTGNKIVSIIDKYRWDYGRKWRPERMMKSTIKLPAVMIDNKWVPDWTFMENYIKSLPYGDKI